MIDFKAILDKIAEFAMSAGVKLLISAVILIVGFKLTGFLVKKLKNRKVGAHTDETVRGFVVSFVSIALKVLIIVTVAAYLGVPMTSMVAVIGSAGVAIGLALQGGLSNIAGGLMIMIFRPFSVGDYISSSSGDGTVASIGIYHTTLVTPDCRRVVIPNSALTSSTVTNYSAEPSRRVDLDFSASYGDDIDKVRAAILSVANGIPQVLKDPAAEVMVAEHSDSAVKYRVRAWCKGEDYWTVYFALQENVKRAFDESGISIPFPQVDVHMVDEKAEK